jgi:hypothetical protein
MPEIILELRKQDDRWRSRYETVSDLPKRTKRALARKPNPAVQRFRSRPLQLAEFGSCASVSGVHVLSLRSAQVIQHAAPRPDHAEGKQCIILSIRRSFGPPLPVL